MVLFMNRRGTQNSSFVVVHWVSDTNTVSMLLRLSDFDPRRTEHILFFIVQLQTIDYWYLCTVFKLKMYIYRTCSKNIKSSARSIFWNYYLILNRQVTDTIIICQWFCVIVRQGKKEEEKKEEETSEKKLSKNQIKQDYLKCIFYILCVQL